MGLKTGWVDYADIPIEREKINILGFAEERINKELEKINKKIEKKRAKFMECNIRENDTRRAMPNAKTSLDLECCERDKWERRLEIIKEWKCEINEKK